ncbi:DUF305 domain-containing protein [Microbacterium sp. W1N]|uniref:DUF305 domain-containing protein n=1 Tax=Microbacterium festucae TaxID=2977531 RepID=UPI0021BF63F5|nr:DUF305 domain-containing protein [Microbacterium festucae]MCT9819012.1 DUF305 domain-containing protein [Microbacterium festucae]
MRRPLAAAVSAAAVLVTGALLASALGWAAGASRPVAASSDGGAALVVTAAQRDAQVDDVPVEADMVFATMMIPHHAQAVELSRILAATPGIDDTSRALAAFIDRDQSAEIVQMTDWLGAWHQIGVMDHDHTGSMAGMATPEQVAALDALEGVAAEKRFLELMIVHHDGALQMTREVIVAGNNSWIRALAKHVAAEQQREIEAMTARLAVL